MNRSDLVSDISLRTGFTKKDISKIVEAYENSVIDAIRNGDSVLLQGFMRIERKIKKEYIGHSFGAKDRKIVPEHEYVKIRPGSTLADCIK